MARKIIPLRRKKQEPKLSRAEQSQRANRTILRRTLVLMALFGVVVFITLIVTLYNLMIRDHDYYGRRPSTTRRATQVYLPHAGRSSTGT